MGFHPGELYDEYLNHSQAYQDPPDVSSVQLPMGTFCLSSFTLHLIIAIDATILVIGVVGNVIACIVIACSKSMHTPTNCYLFSLSMSDLMLLVINAPHEINEIYSPYEFYSGAAGCLLRSWAAEISVNVSVITITAFTFERYLAICRPFVAHAMSQISRVKKLIVVIWLVAIFISLPVALQHRYIEESGVTSCEFDERIIPYSLEVTTALFFVVPVTVITAMYVLIGMNLTRAARNGFSEKHVHARADNNSTRRTVKMLIVIVVGFVVCWAPFHLQRLMTSHYHDLDNDNPMVDANIPFQKAYCIVTHVSGIAYLLTAVINPLIYSIMSSKFREAFEDLLLRSGEKLCKENYYGWRKTFNVTENVDGSATDDTAIFNHVKMRDSE